MDPTDLSPARCPSVDVRFSSLSPLCFAVVVANMDLRKSWVTEFCMRLVNGTVPITVVMLAVTEAEQIRMEHDSCE